MKARVKNTKYVSDWMQNKVVTVKKVEGNNIYVKFNKYKNLYKLNIDDVIFEKEITAIFYEDNRSWTFKGYVLEDNEEFIEYVATENIHGLYFRSYRLYKNKAKILY